jgi:type IV pilus assembly protein PilQ
MLAPAQVPGVDITQADGPPEPPRRAGASLLPPGRRAPASGSGEAEGEGDDSLVLNVPDADVREVLDLLAQQGGLNILASPSVQGRISISLADTDVDSALNAVLRVSGFAARREKNFVFVGTLAELKGIAHSEDRLSTRVYRPNYVTASELEKLITPMLSAETGAISISTAAEVGIATDAANAGGDNYAGGDVLLVRDYETVLLQMDQVVAEVDRKPLQVAIEAMIVAIKLDDTFKMGVDWDFFRNNDNLRLVIGTPPASLDLMNIAEGGIKFGFLDGSLGAFLSALETIGDANVIAAPRLLCLNKQRAEIHIGREVGYVSTTVTENAATETVEFLEVGTQLRLRPYISDDGMIRLEVHPELSTGDVEVREGVTIPDKDVTQVTTNVMIRDGRTVIIGGLIRESLQKSATQVPFFGSLPGAGIAFREKTEEIDREEIIILITPHIVYEPKLGCDGEQALSDYYYRQSIYRDKMSPIGKRFFGRQYYRLAAAAWANGEACKALRYINLSIHHDPMNLQASNLRAEIVANSPYGDRNVHRHLRAGLSPWAHPVGGRRLPFWVYDELGALPEFNQPAPCPYDRGTPGTVRELQSARNERSTTPAMPQRR